MCSRGEDGRDDSTIAVPIFCAQCGKVVKIWNTAKMQTTDHDPTSTLINAMTAVFVCTEANRQTCRVCA